MRSGPHLRRLEAQCRLPCGKRWCSNGGRETNTAALCVRGLAAGAQSSGHFGPADGTKRERELRETPRKGTAPSPLGFVVLAALSMIVLFSAPSSLASTEGHAYSFSFGTSGSGQLDSSPPNSARASRSTSRPVTLTSPTRPTTGSRSSPLLELSSAAWGLRKLRRDESQPGMERAGDLPGGDTGPGSRSGSVHQPDRGGGRQLGRAPTSGGGSISPTPATATARPTSHHSQVQPRGRLIWGLGPNGEDTPGRPVRRVALERRDRNRLKPQSIRHDQPAGDEVRRRRQRIRRRLRILKNGVSRLPSTRAVRS